MERPYLPIPTPDIQVRKKRDPFPPPGVTKPSSVRQQERLGERFDRLAYLLSQGRIGELSQDPSSLAPERALVFEFVGGRIADFARLAQRIGLEFLQEDEDEIDSSDDFKVVERNKGAERIREDKPVPVHFYLGMPDETALNQLVTLWRAYKDGAQFPHGQSAWRDLFDRLLNVRPWGIEDRVQKKDRESFLEQVESNPDTPIRCEIELWYSDNDAQQLGRSNHIANIIEQAGGRALAETRYSFIRYHAILCELPGGVIASVAGLDQHLELLIADGIMFIRPQSVASVADLEEFETQNLDLAPVEVSDAPPLVAVLDGYPVENHNLLAGRLYIDDPDDLAARYASLDSRVHGTSIASLICHGDTNRSSPPIGRRIHVRPVLCSPDGRWEEFPRDQLLIDAIYRAVTRLFEGEGDQPATVPSIRVINISLGDLKRPFARRMSPWARLLDYLSWRYKVLFVVSAGNATGQITIPAFNGIAEFEGASPDDREIAVLHAISSERSTRTILSPSESVNALTIGAQHEDGLADQVLPTGVVDPLVSGSLPAVVSRLGLGYRGAIKPEILSPGGRTLLRMQASGEGLRLCQINPTRFAGIGAAVPDKAGRLNQTANFSDTSTAAALATRQAHLIMEALLREEIVEEGDPILSLYAKALLVHHSKIAPRTYNRVEVVVANGQSVSAKKRDIAKLLGFGSNEYDFPLGCLETRAILAGHHVIRANQCHRYNVPAPVDLDGVRGWRAITVTVAWLSPINPNHQMYRSAKLEVKLSNCLGADGNCVQQVDQHARGKGTVFHTRIEGEAIATIKDGGTFHFDIECLEQTGHLDDPIPYVVAVSIEVGEELAIDIYQKVLERLRIQIH